MNLYYVNATELIKKNNKEKEVTGDHAVPAKDLDHLRIICDNAFIRWDFLRGPYQMSHHWDNFKHNFELGTNEFI